MEKRRLDAFDLHRRLLVKALSIDLDLLFRTHLRRSCSDPLAHVDFSSRSTTNFTACHFRSLVFLSVLRYLGVLVLSCALYRIMLGLSSPMQQTGGFVSRSPLLFDSVRSHFHLAQMC